MVKSGYLLIFSFAVLLLSCQQSQNVEILKTELQLNVTDEKDSLLTGAVVAIFNNDATYLEKSIFYSTEGAIAVDTTSNGVSVISTLNSRDKYRVSVHYKDYGRYPGFYIDMDNNDQNYNVLNNLIEGSYTIADISLKPANGLITFWTEPGNSSQLPLKITFSNKLTDSVTHVFSTKPSPNDINATTVKLKKGQYSYYVSSKTGCVYSDTISLEGGELKYVKLGTCNTGRISFWTAQANNISLPITVTLNNNNNIGDISSVLTTPPVNCYAATLLFADLPPGIYAYTAVSQSSQLVWTGKVTIAKDDCQLIEIK